MAKSNLDTHLQSRIDDFVKEINVIVRQAAVEAVQEALTGSAPARRSSTGTALRKVAKKTGKRVRRTGAQVEALAGKALAAIARGPGRRLGEIARELRVVTKDARRPVQTLLDEKKVKTTGKRGGTRYYPAGAAGKESAKKRTAKRKTKRKTKKRAKK